MRHITPVGLNIIKHYEGFSPVVYRCPAGYDTIGYGHLVRADEDFSEGVTHSQAELLLRNDVRAAEQAVLRLIQAPLHDGQFDALVSFTFNLGAGALQRSTLRQVVNRREYDSAPEQFRRWVWAGGQKLAGLVRRREAEILRFHA